mgnify:CR=1 FL=1
MPKGDRTGPTGQGPMTGRGMGYCASFSVPGFMNPGFGKGLGRGLGRGFAWRVRTIQATPIQQFQPLITKKEEKQHLKKELDALRKEMKKIKRRLKELKD